MLQNSARDLRAFQVARSCRVTVGHQPAGFVVNRIRQNTIHVNAPSDTHHAQTWNSMLSMLHVIHVKTSSVLGFMLGGAELLNMEVAWNMCSMLRQS